MKTHFNPRPNTPPQPVDDSQPLEGELHGVAKKPVPSRPIFVEDAEDEYFQESQDVQYPGEEPHQEPREPDLSVWDALDALQKFKDHGLLSNDTQDTALDSDSQEVPALGAMESLEVLESFKAHGLLEPAAEDRPEPVDEDLPEPDLPEPVDENLPKPDLPEPVDENLPQPGLPEPVDENDPELENDRADEPAVEPAIADLLNELAEGPSEPDNRRAEKRPPTDKQQQQLERKRANSRAWHAKWESKGVLKKQKTEDAAEPEAPAASAASASDSAAPAERGPETFSSLHEARNFFVADWIRRSDMPQSKERHAAACKAWMESHLRANFMASRQQIQK